MHPFDMKPVVHGAKPGGYLKGLRFYEHHRSTGQGKEPLLACTSQEEHEPLSDTGILAQTQTPPPKKTPKKRAFGFCC